MALSGPDGIGKTRLLLDLAGVLEGAFRVAYVPIAALPARELAAWALGALELDVQGDPAETLMKLANEPDDLPLLLAIDEAHAMPPASARQLAGWSAATNGRLALIAAFTPDPRTPRVRMSLGSERVDVAFERPLTPDEANALVLQFVERSDPLPSRRARFDETTLSGLFATSGGLPGRLIDLALNVLEGGPAPNADRSLALAEDFDPFAVTAGAEAYVARRATEDTLATLERELESDAPLLTMIGPPGIGKTQIMRVLADRLSGRFQTLHVAYGSLEPDELERWIAALLGATAGAGALLDHARNAARAGTPFLLMIDDAGAVPAGSLEWLHAQVVSSEGALRIIFAATDSGDGHPLAALEALDPAPRQIPLSDPLDAAESEAWVAARLRDAAAPEPVRKAFDARAVRDLHHQAAGNPAELGRLADERVRGLQANPPVTRSTRQHATGSHPEPEPRSDDQPSRMRGTATWILFGGVTLLALLALLLPSLTDWRPSVTERAPASTEWVSVHINATPWAQVVIDGRELGTTPLGNVQLAIGPHQLRATLADGTLIEREIHIDSDQRHLVITR
ncbi:MAG: AAA family ATPase [bacterium]|nr:AAA family ATPase [bacterium]